MKQLSTILLLCCIYHSASAQQTYTRNYSTFTEYGTIPQSTTPSSYRPFTLPTYTYEKPEKTYEEIKKEEEKEAAAEKRRQAEAAVEEERYNMYLSMMHVADYYDQKNYSEVISSNNYWIKRDLLSKEHQAYYNILLFNALLQEKKYAQLSQLFIDLYKRYPTHTDVFGTDVNYNLKAGDVIVTQGLFKEACDYYDLAHARNQHNKAYQKNYCLATAQTPGREEEASRAFAILTDYENVKPMDYYYSGWYYVDINNELAITHLNKFITAAAEKYDAYLLRATAYYNTGAYNECISDAKEQLKLQACPECEELILKAEAIKKEQASPEYIASQKRKAEELAEQQKQAELLKIAEQKKYELYLAEQKMQKEKAEAEQKKKEENELAAAKRLEEEFHAYITQQGIEELKKEDDLVNGNAATFLDAIKQGDLLSVYVLWKQGNDINAEYGYDGFTLFDAAKSSEFDIAQFLIMNGFDINKVARTQTPLHFICNNSYGYSREIKDAAYKTAKLLIDKGADVNAVNEFGQTPLHNTASSGNIELAKLLLDQGARTDIKSKYEHRTPAGVARYYGQDEIIKLLKAY